MIDLTRDHILVWQMAQHKHDRRNHFDIVARHKVDRFKHYALHFAKYAGRLARGEEVTGKSIRDTATDSVLVSLSSANTVPQRLADVRHTPLNLDATTLKNYIAWTGIYCDAVEKIDHAEFDGIRESLIEANQELFDLALGLLWGQGCEPSLEIARRRDALANRVFFVKD